MIVQNYHTIKKMNDQELAQQIIANVGGKNNINHVFHCATRLRFNLVDESKVNEEALNALRAIMKVVKKSGQVQLVIGAEVDQVYAAVIDKIGELEQKGQGKKLTLLDQFLDLASSTFGPLIPPILAASIISIILTLGVQLGIITDTTSVTYRVFDIARNSIFYYFPVMIGFSLAKKLKVNPYIAAAIGLIIVHPDMLAVFSSEEPLSLFGLPMKNVTYPNSVIPMAMAVGLQYYVEKAVYKYTPSMLKTTIAPFIVTVVVLVATLIVLGPIGAIVGEIMCKGVEVLQQHANWLALGLVGGAYLILTATGLGKGLLPILFTTYATFGYEKLVLVAATIAALSQGFAALAVAVKTKSSSFKATCVSTAVTSFLGINEPVIFSVLMPLKKPAIYAMIGATVAGVYAGFFHIKTYAMASGLLAFPAFINDGNTFMIVLIWFLLASVIPFVLTLLFGFDDIEEK